MGIRESALSTLSALTNNDFIRMVSSAGASRKATLQAIAQHIIEQYAGSSLLGKQQSVKSALDELNSTIELEPTVYGTRITIAYSKCVQIGRIVYVNIRGTANQNLNGNTIVTGLPTPTYTQYLTINKSLATAEIRQRQTDGIVANGVSNGDIINISGAYFL